MKGKQFKEQVSRIPDDAVVKMEIAYRNPDTHEIESQSYGDVVRVVVEGGGGAR